jgi:tetratricopeptide (TPR) repeat protein
MVSRACFIVVLAFFMGAILPRSLRADPAPLPTADQRKAAKAYVDAGLAAERQGDYEAAIQLYRKAHDLIPHPVLLFNMAQAHRLAGRRAEALDLYRSYLAAKPRGDLAAQAKGWVRDYEAAIAREYAEAEAEAKALADRKAREAARAAAEDSRKRKAEATSPAVVVAPSARPPTTLVVQQDEAVLRRGPSERPDSGRVWRIAGISAAGVGAGAVVAGAFCGIRAMGIADDLSEPGVRYDPERDADGEFTERTMYVLYGVGGALIAGGVVTYVLNRPGADEPATLTATIDGSHVFFAIADHF